MKGCFMKEKQKQYKRNPKSDFLTFRDKVSKNKNKKSKVQITQTKTNEPTFKKGYFKNQFRRLKRKTFLKQM